MPHWTDDVYKVREPEKETVEVYQEDERGRLSKVSARTVIHKDTQMTATLKDGRRVWFDVERNKWIIPIRASKGEVEL